MHCGDVEATGEGHSAEEHREAGDGDRPGDEAEDPVAEVGKVGEPAVRDAGRDGVCLDGRRDPRLIEPDHQVGGEEEGEGGDGDKG